MGKEPNISNEEITAQTESLYAKVGKIVVLSEHLNAEMSRCCSVLLEVQKLPQIYAQTVLIGQNLENMRRTWESLMKVFYADNIDTINMINHLSTRLDNIIQRRNDTVHRLWYIGWGNEQTESYEIAISIKGKRDIGKKGGGGIKYTNKDTKDFEEIIDEIQKLTTLVKTFMICVAFTKFYPDGRKGNPDTKFDYDEKGQLIDRPSPEIR